MAFFKITRSVIVGEVNTDANGKGRPNVHEVSLAVIGKDYQTVHWNDKADGVEYNYTLEGESQHKVTIDTIQLLDLDVTE